MAEEEGGKGEKQMCKRGNGISRRGGDEEGKELRTRKERLGERGGKAGARGAKELTEQEAEKEQRKGPQRREKRRMAEHGPWARSRQPWVCECAGFPGCPHRQQTCTGRGLGEALRVPPPTPTPPRPRGNP